VKHYRKILSITINCMIFLLVACPSAWLLDRELKTVKDTLRVGREAKKGTCFARADETSDPWMKWKYIREILVIDPKDGWALSWKGKIANECARKARDLMSQGQTPEAISTLVLAIRADPQVSYLWVWLEDWIKAWVEENREPRATPRPAPAKPR
jgi:hypothetical protein